MTVSPRSDAAPKIDIVKTMERARAAWRADDPDEAEMACQQVLAVWPGQPDASYLMGLMAHHYANLDLALAHLRRACQAPRAPAHFFSDFAEMCRQGGLLAEGEQAARRAVALAPNSGAAWNNLGIILQEMLKLDESRLCLERALALEPNNAETFNNLGNTLKRLGRAAEAEEHWTAALKFKPDYAEAYSNLSNLLNDQGEYERAEAMALKALELSPRLADAYINLAGVASARHRYLDALGWLEALLAFAPMHGRALAARSLTLKELDRLDEAMEAARQALAAAPDSPEAHNAEGQVFQAMGRFEPALRSYDRAVALPGPAQKDAVSNRASLFMEFGKAEEARAAFEAAAKTFPNSAAVLLSQTDLKHIEPGDPLLAEMGSLIARDGLSVADRTALHFGLGKAYLDLGESREAFRHYNEGNRLKRATFAYDPDETDRWMKHIAEVFSRDLLEAKAGLGARSRTPILVVGMPRSGTTLTEQILASHPMAHGAGELRRLQSLGDELGFPESFRTLPARKLETAGEAYLATIAPLAAGRPHVVDKMPANFALLGMIRLILPDARIIHCRREPVDTCLSCYTKLFAAQQAFSYNQTELGRFHCAYQGLMAHWRAVLPASHFLEVDYEAVVEDVGAQARRMLDFLGLPWDAAVLRFHETERPVRTASSNQVRQPIYRSSAGRWRKHAAELQPLLAALGVEDGLGSPTMSR
jgi:tetratricopeptide (TPR) repeat protein